MTDRKTPQTAVWYFVGATFIFAGPTLFFRDTGLLWVPILSMALGAVVFAAGLVVFVRELEQARAARQARDAGHGGTPPPPPAS